MSNIIYIGKFKKSSTGTEDSVICALEHAGHSVTRLDYLSEPDISSASGQFDIAIFSKCEPISAEQLDGFECGKKVMWIFDSLHHSTMDSLRSGAENILQKAKIMDYLFTAAPGDVSIYKDRGCRNAFHLPQAYDDIEFPPQDVERDLDITFVGNNYGSHRIDIVGKVHKRYGNHFKLYSKTNTWNVPVEGPLSSSDAMKVFSRSKITLNMSETPEDDKWSRRVWDAMGNGAVVAAQYCPSLDRYFSAGDIVTWDNIGQLLDVIDGLLDDEPRISKISTSARNNVLRNHTYKNRVVEFLQVIDGG